MNAAPHATAVRDEVLKLLEQAPAYKALAPEAALALREHMIQIGTYLADPNAHGAATALEATGVRGNGHAGPDARALDDGDQQAAPQGEKQVDAVDATKQRLSEKPGQVGSGFTAGAMREGTDAFGALVQKVNFPDFVSGLVKGVFQAVVDASIQQMQAYGELLAATAKSVQQFADDHISDSQARDQLANRFPSKFRIDTSGDGPAKLASRDGSEVDLGGAYGTDGAVDVSDEEAEQALVNQAKLDMARQRQQTMATMVLMGINRIVVTNGQINAKVLFDVQADDKAARHATAEMHDATSESDLEFGGGSFLGMFGGGFARTASHSTTVASAIDDTSESKAQMKAQLSGDVHLAFKSDVFPLEKMVDIMGMQTLNQRAAPLPIGPRATPGQPAAPAPAPVAAPAPAPAAATPAK